MEHRGNLAAGFQTFCHFQVDVCLQKIPGSSRPGRSVGVGPGFIKGPCDGISIRDDDGGRRAELPASLICNTRRRDFRRRLCSSITSETGIPGDNSSRRQAAETEAENLTFECLKRVFVSI